LSMIRTTIFTVFYIMYAPKVFVGIEIKSGMKWGRRVMRWIMCDSYVSYISRKTNTKYANFIYSKSNKNIYRKEKVIQTKDEQVIYGKHMNVFMYTNRYIDQVRSSIIEQIITRLKIELNCVLEDGIIS
jgi:hypothetical protein